jgi:hypothetical protein
MSIVENLWNSTMDYGYNVRSKRIDGLKAWNKIKSILEKYNTIIEWSKESIARYDDLTQKVFKIIDEENSEEWDNEKKKKWELEHFFLQHARIIHNNQEPPNSNLTRLMQIAYNAGQFNAERDNKSYPDEILNYYDKNNLSSYISYTNPGNIVSIDRILASQHPAVTQIKEETILLNNDSKKGGNIFSIGKMKHKYLKYTKKIDKI